MKNKKNKKRRGEGAEKKKKLSAIWGTIKQSSTKREKKGRGQTKLNPKERGREGGKERGVVEEERRKRFTPH